MLKKICKSYSIYLGALLMLISSCSGNIEAFYEDLPSISQYDTVRPTVTKVNDSLFYAKNNYLLKNKFKQWELYIQGDPYHRGLLIGALEDSIMNRQEEIFFDKVKTFLPTEKKQKKILKYLRWFNRDMFEYIPDEYKITTYGLTRYVNHTYDYVAPRYIRHLYLLGAHDIGHALVDMSKINMACTSTALWGENTPDGKLLVGRNLDFYVGDKFAQNIVLYFVNPTKGIPYVSVGWPGFIGVVSGMNKAGVTVTMNAGKSKIPLKAKEPISIVAKEILQYASNIEEAVQIAKESEVFVSEALLVSSAKDNRAVSIEMSPGNFGVYEAPNSKLICTNHFQSEAYKNDNRNQKRIANGHSVYRYKRMQELIDSMGTITPKEMVAILRNKKGIHNVALGYGNEKAINQLLCHHAVVFKPSEKLIWISSIPYNLGAFVAYDLDEIFNSSNALIHKSQHIDSLVIPKSKFLSTEAYTNYQKYRRLDKKIDNAIEQHSTNFSREVLHEYCELNPNFWSVYYKTGMLLYYAEAYKEAKKAFETALSKVVTTVPDKQKVKEMIKKTNKAMR